MEGLKLAPPKTLPMRLMVKTRRVAMTVVMERPAREEGWRLRKEATWLLKILRLEALKTHIDVRIASPMAAFINPIILQFLLQFLQSSGGLIEKKQRD